MTIGPNYHFNYLAAPSYLRPDTNEKITDILRDRIFHMHERAGHMQLESQGYKLVTGAGALQIVSALVHSLGTRRGMKVYCEPPYFDEFPNIANMIENTSFSTATNMDPKDVIEILTYPNNPDGYQYKARYSGAIQIHDYVYSWPHITTVVPELADIMVFSLSKLAGYAASRFGWAFIKDEALATKMEKYIFLNWQGAGIESKYHAARVFKAISDSIGTPTDFFAYSRGIVSRRWARVQNVFRGSKKYSLAKTVPGMPYVWITCTGTEDCVKDFRAAGVEVGSGAIFGASDKTNVRIVIMQEQPTFNLIMNRIAKMVHAEQADQELQV